MKSPLKKRIENLEAKATSAAQKPKPENEADMAARIETLYQDFDAICDKGKRRAALPLADQLRISREELDALLAKQAEQKLCSIQDGSFLDDGLLRLEERMKRSWIQHLEASVLQESLCVDIGA